MNSLFSNYFNSTHRVLLLGILFGIKSQIPLELSTALKNSGTIHTVVVSGFNINIVFNTLFVLTSKLGKRVSFILSIFSVLYYVHIVGPTPPVLRALFMCLMYRFSKLCGRESRGLYILIASMIVMLTINPHLISDISFQFSFTSTLGLILFNSKINNLLTKLPILKHFPKLVLEPFSETISANLL